MKVVVENVPLALANPSDYAARANLMLCGTYALNGGMISVGMANDWACHGIEHELSGHYDIPHGAGLAIVFPNWMRYVYRERIDRFVQFALRVWDVDPAGKSDEAIALEGIQATRNYLTRIGNPSTLREVGIGDGKFDAMAAEATRRGAIGHFKRLEREDVMEIYRMSL